VKLVANDWPDEVFAGDNEALGHQWQQIRGDLVTISEQTDFA
jgi:hypothetical protein